MKQLHVRAHVLVYAYLINIISYQYCIHAPTSYMLYMYVN